MNAHNETKRDKTRRKRSVYKYIEERMFAERFAAIRNGVVVVVRCVVVVGICCCCCCRWLGGSGLLLLARCQQVGVGVFLVGLVVAAVAVVVVEVLVAESLDEL